MNYKTNYTEQEFNSPKGVGISQIDRMIANAKNQGVDLTKEEAVKACRVSNICGIRRLSDRFEAFNNAGLMVTQAPMKTGFGVGQCLKRMSDGRLRVRVSANWSGGKYGNYSDCVHI